MASNPTLMFCEAALYVRCYAGIERAILALHYIYKIHVSRIQYLLAGTFLSENH